MMFFPLVGMAYTTDMIIPLAPGRVIMPSPLNEIRASSALYIRATSPHLAATDQRPATGWPEEILRVTHRWPIRFSARSRPTSVSVHCVRCRQKNCELAQPKRKAD
jgi:hypothetical protein